MLRQLRAAFDDFRDALRTSEPSSEAENTGRGPGETPPSVLVEAPPTVPAESEPARSIALPKGRVDAVDGGDAIAASAATRGDARWSSWALPTLATLGVVVLGIVILRWPPWASREPADPTVMATYVGGVITGDDLRRKLETLPREEQARFRAVAGLRALAGDLATERAIRRWAQERQVDQQDAFRDAMRHATEEIQVADVAQQLHEGRIPVGEAEIQTYYDRERQRFGDRPLVEVREQIRRLAVEEKEQGFVREYLKELRERANLQVDYSLLDVPEPTEPELTAYYQSYRERFRVPEQVRIAQIQVSVSLAGGDDKARAKAESARARAAAGEEIARIAAESSDGPEKASGGELAGPVARGGRGPAFDEAVFPLQPDGLSPAFREGDSYYVVKLLERWPERLRLYEEVRAEILDTVRVERERQIFEERASRTLFSIHGRRTTLGELLHELEALPPESRAQFVGAEGKRKLLDRLIERLLVVEDAAEQTANDKRTDEIEHAQVALLAQFLHDEEVDAKARVTDEEVRAEYDRNRAHFDEPPRVKVRYVRVGRGRTADSDQKARVKIEEAAALMRPRGLLGGGPPSDFAEVASRYSEDERSAAQGGLLDRWVAESGDPAAEVFEHALHEELFPLGVGDVSRILPLGDSYYLFQIVEKQEPRARSFEEVQADVRRDLEAHKHERLARDMQRQLFERVQLQIYDRRLESLLAELGAPAGRPR
jgi:parvulin-like peptidyl-prolyl isomerase